MSKKLNIDPAVYLRSVEPYSALDASLFSRLSASARVQRVERGRVLFEQGEHCSGVHVVVSGQIKLAFCSAQGVEKVVGIATAGEGVGEACISISKSYPVYGETLSETELIFLPKNVLCDCLEVDQDFSYRLMMRIAEKFHGLLLDIESTCLQSGAERIIAFLLRQLERGGTSAGTDAVVELTVPKAVIASRLSLTQEHFSRLLRQLSEHGMIVVEGRHIHIPEVARLRRYLDSGAGHCANRSGRSSGRGRAGWERLAAA